MAKQGKFNTFGGVFTPSILTILGVIMYLRLPRVVGSAGLYATLGIILVAHVISIATGLSISSIATDKRVGAGGPYYVLSRSLGLPLGGTIGLALFIGLSFSISLYVIGFTESLLGYLGLEPSAAWIRIVGTATVILLTIITFVSTSLAIKTQYLILALIGLSLGSIFLGGSDAPKEPSLMPAAEAPSLALMFGIFFPAVTGFTAGVNMSGDLKDPKRSIPRGTILAIAVGLVTYVSLAVFLGFRVDAATLRNDPEVLQNIAWFAPLVIAGIWGATLSSALGSILGAPRILQSMSSDRVTPAVFAKGYGPTSEPRNALVLAFLVGEAGILIAELDLIARVVSMVFLAMYGFINVACAIENWSNTDFRPTFRIPTAVSVLGAVTCLVVMIQLDLLAMVGSLVLMLGLYAFLQRRRLALDSGDAWEGVWSALVRAGLRKLNQVTPLAHNWKPNILAFSLDAQSEAQMRPITLSLIATAGVATEFRLGKAVDHIHSVPPLDELDSAASIPGLFARDAPCDDPLAMIATLAKHYGFSGIRPNTLLLPLGLHADHSDGIDSLLRSLRGTRHNLLLARGMDESKGELNLDKERTIDVWWSADAGNFSFSVALVRFLSRSGEWRNARVRFWLLTTESAGDDVLAMEARQYLRKTRLEAEVRLFQQPASIQNPMEVVVEECAHTAFVIAGLPDVDATAMSSLHEGCNLLDSLPGQLLVYRASERFPEVLRHADSTTTQSLAPQPLRRTTAPLPQLQLPQTPKLADAVVAFDARVQDLMEGAPRRTIAQVYRDNQALMERFLEATVTLIEHAEPELIDNGGRPREGLRQAVEQFRLKVQAEIQQFENTVIEEQHTLLEACISSICKADSWLSNAQTPVVTVSRALSDYQNSSNDTPIVRSIKRRARLWGRLGRGHYSYKLPLSNLETYYHNQITQRFITDEVLAFLDDSHQLALELSKALNRPLRQLALSRSMYGSDGERDGTREHFQELRRVCEALLNRQKTRREEHSATAAARGRDATEAFSRDIGRIDVAALVHKFRRIKASDAPDVSALRERLLAWKAQQSLLLQRVVLGQQQATMLERLSAHAFAIRDEVLLGPGAACLHDCERLASQLRRAVSGRGMEPSAFERFVGRPAPLWEPATVVERLSADVSSVVAQIPEVVQALPDDTLLELMAGNNDEVDAETFEVNLRRGLDVVVSRELLGPMQQQLHSVKAAQSSAWNVIDDVAQLMAFQLNNSPDGVVALAERSLIRLTRQRDEVLTTQDAVRDLTTKALEHVAGTTNVTQLEKLQEQLQGEDFYKRARAAEQGAKSILSRLRSSVSITFTELLYRQSRGLLASKRFGQTRRASASAELKALVERTLPSTQVSELLPQFYRQLFSGQAAVGGSFQVARPTQQAALSECIAATRRSESGAIVVLGEPGSGKTTVIAELLGQLRASRVLRVQAPEGGTASLKRFKLALGGRSSANPLADLPDNAAVVVDDLELWWERRDGGLSVVEYLLNGAREYGQRLTIVLSTSTYSYHLLDRLMPVSSTAAATFECEPFSAEELRQAVLRRHQSTGLKFALGSHSEEQVTDWTIAKLFTRYFEYCSGNIGATFRGWLAHIESTDGETLVIRIPADHDWDALDEMDGDAKSLLLQLILHKRASRDRLRRIYGREESDIERVVQQLTVASILVNDGRGVVSINEAVRHQLALHFLKRGLL